MYKPSLLKIMMISLIILVVLRAQAQQNTPNFAPPPTIQTDDLLTIPIADFTKTVKAEMG